MPIIRICQGQPMLAVRLTSSGCNGSQLVDWQQVRLVVAPPACKRQELPLSPQCFSGCWPAHDIEKWNNSFILPEDETILIYPAFGINADGEIEFALDSQLWKKRGRYVGHIEFLDGSPITELDLDICSQRFIADKVTVTSVNCRG